MSTASSGRPSAILIILLCAPSADARVHSLESYTLGMTIDKNDIRKVRNKVVRGQLLAKAKKDKSQAKLKKRIARKQAEQRGETVERGAVLSVSLSEDLEKQSRTEM